MTKSQSITEMTWLGLLLLLWNTVTEATWRGKGLLGLYFHITVHHGRKLRQELKQGRNLETAANAEDMEGCCLQACSS